MSRVVAAVVTAVALSGCARAPSPPVSVVPTRTPGVAFVIVHPFFENNPGATPMPANADYVLVCDARGSDGMACTMPNEVAKTRVSTGLAATVKPQPIDAGVATVLSDDTKVRVPLVVPPPAEGEPKPAGETYP